MKAHTGQDMEGEQDMDQASENQLEKVTTGIEQELQDENENIKKALEEYSSPPLPPRDHIATESVVPELPPRNHDEAEKNDVIRSESEGTGKDTGKATVEANSDAEPTLPPRNIEEQRNVVVNTDFLAYNNKRIRDLVAREGPDREEEIYVNIGTLKEKYKEQISKLEEGQYNPIVATFIQCLPDISLRDLIEEEKILLSTDLKFRDIVWPILSFNYVKSENLNKGSNEAITKFLERHNITDEETLTRYTTVLTTYYSETFQGELCDDIVILLNAIDIVTKDEQDFYIIFESLLNKFNMKEVYYSNNDKDIELCYIFERFLEDNHKALYNHLSREGLSTKMYLPVWIRTLFRKQLNEDIAVKIVDIILLEGLEGLLRIALALIVGNEDKLLRSKFEDILSIIKNLDPMAELSSEFITEAMASIELKPKAVIGYKYEYEEIHRLEREREEQFDYVKNKNKNLQEKVKKLEHDYTFLNREHVTIANELVNSQLNIEQISVQNNELRIELINLRKELAELTKQKDIETGKAVPDDMKKELTNILAKNSRVMTENLQLQDKVSELEKTAEDIKRCTEEGKLYEDPSASSWTGLKKISTKF
ncbi:hypothetical protein B1J92_K10934g [Nakaseomyces glabratus]|nr:hypothetical protein B1J91_K10934g [Nakaseomyces glabratus]OXB47073.1 hypothetical protein B1J92_K10934g [Nakaseomyces glabratus]